MDEGHIASHEYIRRIRDAFVECVKLAHRQVLQHATKEVKGGHVTTLYVSYIHDEASLKLRSWQRTNDEEMPGVRVIFRE